MGKLRKHPEMMEQIRGMMEEVEDGQGGERSFDDMEEQVVKRVREIGRLGLQGWAQNKAEEAERSAPEEGARRGAKKK